MPPPDTIDAAYDLMTLAFIETLTESAADMYIAGQVRASKLLGIPLNFNLISSRAVMATDNYRKMLTQYGGSEVTVIENGVASRVFKPWLIDAAKQDKEQIGAIIKEAIQSGKPLPQVEKELADVFGMREHNAKLTAYQETKSIYQKGTFDRFYEEGIKTGIWHHMMPQPNPREEHMALDGQEFPIDDPVWALLDEPNCHCWCEPVIKVYSFDNIFNPGQERDNSGRWSSGGGSSAPGSTGTITIKAPNTKLPGDTPVKAAARIKTQSHTDDQFVKNVRSYVDNNVKYIDRSGSWDVKSPEAALDEGKGDCSEQALITEAMLKSQGIDARLVHGITKGGEGGIPHDTVEIHIGKYPKNIDADVYPNFIKMGEGLHPKERVI